MSKVTSKYVLDSMRTLCPEIQKELLFQRPIFINDEREWQQVFTFAKEWDAEFFISRSVLKSAYYNEIPEVIRQQADFVWKKHTTLQSMIEPDLDTLKYLFQMEHIPFVLYGPSSYLGTVSPELLGLTSLDFWISNDYISKALTLLGQHGYRSEKTSDTGKLVLTKKETLPKITLLTKNMSHLELKLWGKDTHTAWDRFLIALLYNNDNPRIYHDFKILMGSLKEEVPSGESVLLTEGLLTHFGLRSRVWVLFEIAQNEWKLSPPKNLVSIINHSLNGFRKRILSRISDPLLLFNGTRTEDPRLTRNKKLLQDQIPSFKGI